MTGADFTSHHIEGYAMAARERGWDGNFRVPLITHVVGNLWQGGCIDGVRLPDDFDYVISLYPWEKYAIGPTTTRHEFEMFDAAAMPDEAELRRIARLVNECESQGKTLVHCQAGLNRSGLVAGLSLVMRGAGTSGQVIALLRYSRCDMVLCNETFESWLLREHA